MTKEEVLKLIEDGRIIPIQIKANDEETSKYNLQNLEGINMIVKALKQEDRLDNTISDINYILGSLILLRQIQSTGDCNNCKNKNCEYAPGLGQIVRYNCPFYKAEKEG